MADQEDSSGELRKSIRVVGIGASAGGLESLQRLFDHLTQPLDAAYVVIQHLSPNYETMMDQLLARHTSMPVCIARDQQQLVANCVYVLPPKKDIVVRNGRLLLTEQARDEIPHLPIDRFFSSMAKDCDSRCAAIVLSGTGSDGSQGIRDVRAVGGLVIAETESTAKFGGMPRSALATGCVDYAVTAESIAGILQAKLDGLPILVGESGEFATDELQQIFDLLRQHCHVDFAEYKPSTISRRIDRRMSICRVSSLRDYTALVRANPVELESLYHDMLIGVTNFFRDVACFEYLEAEIIPGLIDRADPRIGVRVWVAGCASGEEAYSLAILFDEARRRLQKEIDVKIFASDIHPGALRDAAEGRYAPERLSNVSATRLAHYFVRDSDKFAVVKTLRQMVLFSPHNVLQDPPFTNLDMVACRNLLIYFDQQAQTKALTFFHFALKQNGILFLGPSETCGRISAEFDLLNERCKLYSKRHDAKLPADVRLPIPLKSLPAAERTSKLGSRRGKSDSERLYDLLLDSVLPPTLLVDDQQRVIESFGGAEKLLHFRPRRVSTNVLDICPPELQSSLSVVLRRAVQTQAPASLYHSGHADNLDLEIGVRPLRAGWNGCTYYVVQFVPVERSELANESQTAGSSDANRTQSASDISLRIRAFEDELDYTRENLQSTIEELETSNEELQSTNEELMSSNEELQSTNEELNSVNEELHTVNVEYQNKNSELRQLNDDMNHLLASTDIGTIFLDKSLRVRRFTPRIATIFSLEPLDIGRPLSSFTHNLKINDLELHLQKVLSTGEVFEREILDNKQQHYYLRILPYEVDDQISGVIVTLTDITALVETRELAEKFERRLQKAIDAVPVFVSFVNRDLRYEYANLTYTKWLNLRAQDVIGKPVRDVLGDAGFEVSKPYIEKVLQGEPQTFEQEIESTQGTMFICVNYSPARAKNGRVIGFYVSGADITSLKAAEAQLAQAAELQRQANQAKSDFIAKMSHEIRSPMTAILGFADILDEQVQSEDNRNCIDIIRRNGFHLLDLINDILDLSRIESGHFELELESFEPIDLLKECYNTVLPRASENNVDLQLRLGRGLSANFLGDRRRVRQIILNLLTNAVKFSQDERVVVHCRRSQRTGELVLTVADTGCGIAPSDLPRLFEPFCQADNSDARKYEGTGLGLAITQQLVEQMKGRIAVRSRLAMGTLFRVHLPWREESARRSNEARERVQLDRRTPRLDGYEILVIDDRRDIRFIAEHLLSRAGAAVESAENGRAGIERVALRQQAGQTFDCIVTDIQMPDMDGYETTRQLRANGFGGPILALTAGAMEADRDRCIEAGCNAHIAKPIHRVEFIGIIASLLGKDDDVLGQPN